MNIKKKSVLNITLTKYLKLLPFRYVEKDTYETNKIHADTALHNLCNYT